MTEHELDKLLQEYGGAVRAVCRAILPGHPQDAEEAEADTFYKLWRGSGQWRTARRPRAPAAAGGADCTAVRH